jgi:NADH:ubiquinone oxidoreductase subunit 5 (subunit L)/multisubunit Na+/H+ antiporter MnhA subunit
MYKELFIYNWLDLNSILYTFNNNPLILNLNNFFYSSDYTSIYNYISTNFFLLKGVIFHNFLDVPFFFWFGSFFLLTIGISFLFISYLGLYGVFFLNLISLGLFWLSLLPYIKPIMIDQIVYNIFVGKWFYLNYNTKVNFNFLIDPVSFSFILLTTTIGFFVYIYAFSYFRYEPLVDRFLLFLCSFIISMIFLVSSGNLIMMFLGWELIGLTSFFLINFWVTRVGTLKAAFKAFSFNKISDFFMLMFIIVIYNFLYDFDIQSINNQIHLYYNFKINLLNVNINLIELLSFIILSAAFIKSAQLGPHVWLPDSMEAPVPASSLIHSATLVSAGIFLILRFYPIFEYSYYAFIILPVIGSLTAAYGGLIAAFQSDIKRILAYSTISHCGFLMLLCSFNLNEFVVLYLYVHGFFKASVFMCVGNVIRISKNYQDFRRMGMFYKYLPFECFCAFVCLFNLAGLPFSLGFFIKHLLFLGNNNNIILYYFVIFNVLIGAVAGLFYSHRLFYYVFFDFKKGKKAVYKYINRNSLYSVYYSNTSLASNCAILSLVFVSYIISFYLLINLCNINSNFSDYSNNLNYSNYFNLFNVYNGFLFNLSYLNWIVILLIVGFLFISWRNLFNSYLILDNFNHIILFFIFFLINYQYFF